MADTKINRSFIPPTETEKVDSEVYPIVWALGTTEHPWKNLFLSDYETKEGETLKVIDVYSTLKDVGDIPKTEKEYGNVLTVDQDKSSLKWKTIDDVIATHATANTLVSKISSTPVQRAEADEDGLNIKNNYFKQTSFTANKIKSTLGNVAVKRAEADSSGNKFQDTYVNRDYIDNNYIHRTGSSTSSALTDQGLGAVCFTNSYNDLDDRPQIPQDACSEEFVRRYVNNDNDKTKGNHYNRFHVPLDTRLTADETQITTNKNNIDVNTANIATNTTNISTNASNITAVNNRVTALDAATVHWEDYATTSKAGIVKISTANGLNIGSSGLLNVDKATSSKVGVVKVNGGNGLVYNSSNGSISINKATTGQLGTVQIGGNINVSGGTISVDTADTSKLGLVKVGNNLQVNSGTISVYTADTSKLGVVKVGSNITNSSGTISLTKSNIVSALGYTPIETAHQPGEIFAVIGVGTGYAISGCVPCDGSTYTAAMYPNFWNNYINNGKLKTCTLTVYNDEISKLNGQCAKWGKGKNSSNQDIFRVPTLPSGTFIQQGTSGERFAPGLPNIKGRTTAVQADRDWKYLANGVFELESTFEGQTDSANGRDSCSYDTFDASRSSEVYKDDVTTVQPQSVCVQFYVCIANIVPDRSSIDWSKWETAMSLKMDKNSWGTTKSSVSKDNPSVCIKSYVNGTKGYRIYSDGYCEQWGRVTTSASDWSTVSLDKTFADTNYNVTISAYLTDNTNPRCGYASASTFTTKSFKVICADDSSANPGVASWRACGYLASGQY